MKTIPCHTIAFAFNQEAQHWLDTNIPALVDRFDIEYLDSGGPWFSDPESTESLEFQQSPPAQQMISFLASFGLTDTFIHPFMYKIDTTRVNSILENPHIDTPNSLVLSSRLNVVYEDDGKSKMHWWDIDIDSPKVHEFIIPTSYAKRWNIIGNSRKERFDLIGSPDYSTSTLSIPGKTADLVKTDIVHSIERTGSRRIMISARIYYPWEHVCAKFGVPSCT